jgi:hypothetical protein
MYNEIETDRKIHLEPLFLRYKVDIGNWGHHHCYIRSYPTINARPTQLGDIYKNPNGIVHVTVGTGGPLIDYDSFTCKFGSIPTFVAKKIHKHGFLRMNVFNETTIQFQFMGMDDEKPSDEFYIIKDRV